MTKRRTFIVGFVLATVACATPVAGYLLRDPINESACERIKEGMTEADVIRILGRPCDETAVGEDSSFEPQGGEWRETVRPTTEKIWNGPGGTLGVGFDEAGLVKGVGFRENADSDWFRVRRWLGIDPPGEPRPYIGVVVE